MNGNKILNLLGLKTGKQEKTHMPDSLLSLGQLCSLLTITSFTEIINDQVIKSNC